MTRDASSGCHAWRSASAATARYTSALREAAGRVPEHRVDWEAFHIRLGARAELALALLRDPHLMPRSWELARHDQEVEHQPALTWWEHAARWSRAIVATSVAAGIALVMVVRASPKETPETVVATAVVAATASTTDAPRAAFESAVIGHGSASFMSAALLPTATDLLIPLGSGGQTR